MKKFKNSSYPRGTSRKVSSTQKFSDLIQVTKGYDNSLRNLGNSRIPRNVFSSQPYKSGVVTIHTEILGQLTGGILPFMNQPMINTLYRVLPGSTTVWAGGTQIQAKYAGFFPVELRMKKMRFHNRSAGSLMLSVCPVRAPVAAGSGSIVKSYLLPQAKTVMLTPTGTDPHQYHEFRGIKCNASSLYGYDVTMDSINHSGTFSADPAYSSGIEIVALSNDGTNVPLLDYHFDVEVDVIPIFPVDLIN